MEGISELLFPIQTLMIISLAIASWKAGEKRSKENLAKVLQAIRPHIEVGEIPLVEWSGGNSYSITLFEERGGELVEKDFSYEVALQSETPLNSKITKKITSKEIPVT